MILFEKKKKRGSLHRFVWEKLGEMERVVAGVTLLFRDDDLYSMEFYSSLHGIYHINLETGKSETKSWEGEKEAQEVSNLNYHYTAKLLSHEIESYYSNYIIEDVLKHIGNKELNEILITVLRKSKKFVQTDFSKWLAE